MNTCDSCRWWKIENGGFGQCQCPKTSDSLPEFDGMGIEWPIDSYIVTGPKFGCIHYERSSPDGD